MYLTEPELKTYKELFESQPLPINFAGGKIKARGVDIWGHLSPDGVCKKIETKTDEYCVFQLTK